MEDNLTRANRQLSWSNPSAKFMVLFECTVGVFLSVCDLIEWDSIGTGKTFLEIPKGFI